jgi:hypothetical protein
MSVLVAPLGPFLDFSVEPLVFQLLPPEGQCAPKLWTFVNQSFSPRFIDEAAVEYEIAAVVQPELHDPKYEFVWQDREWILPDDVGRHIVRLFPQPIELGDERSLLRRRHQRHAFSKIIVRLDVLPLLLVAERKSNERRGTEWIESCGFQCRFLRFRPVLRPHVIIRKPNGREGSTIVTKIDGLPADMSACERKNHRRTYRLKTRNCLFHHPLHFFFRSRWSRQLQYRPTSTRHDVYRFLWWTWRLNSVAQALEEFDGVNEWCGPAGQFGLGAVPVG